jgi:hypothetical protein
MHHKICWNTFQWISSKQYMNLMNYNRTKWNQQTRSCWTLKEFNKQSPNNTQTSWKIGEFNSQQTRTCWAELNSMRSHQKQNTMNNHQITHKHSELYQHKSKYNSKQATHKHSKL